MIKQLSGKLSLLCLSVCLVGAAQANEPIAGISFAEVPQIADMACYNPDPELEPNTREVNYVVRNNGNETIQLGNVNIENHDDYADSLMTVLYDEANDCKTSLAAGQTCNIRVQITPPQCPAHPTEGYLMPIEGEALTRTLQVGPIDSPINGNLTTLGAAAAFLALSGQGGIDNREGTAQIDGAIGTTKMMRGIKGDIDADSKHRNDALVKLAQLDLGSAYKTLSGMSCDRLSSNLGHGHDGYKDDHVSYVTPGVYCPQGFRDIIIPDANESGPSIPAPVAVNVSGTFVLDGNESRSNDIFVFNLGRQNLTTFAEYWENMTEVKLINGARANRVFWLLDTGNAEIHARTKFVGNIILLNKQSMLHHFAPTTNAVFAGISLLTDNVHSPASLRGRALIVDHRFGHQHAPIKLEGNNISDPFAVPLI